MECKIQIKDEVNCKISGLDLSMRKKLVDKFKYDIPGAKYQPAVRLGRWDGRVAFFQLGGSTYINLLPDIIPILDQHGYEIELEDLREYSTGFNFQEFKEDIFASKTWPERHPLAGQPIKFRDYQVEIINNFLRNPQSVQEIATGSGKCLAGDTFISLEFDENTEFGNFLLNKLRPAQVSDVTKYCRKVKKKE